MKYNEDYIYSKDIDWFFVANGKYVHVASAGGMIPEIFNDREKLRDIQRKVFHAPDIYTDEQLDINEDFIRQKLAQSEKLGQSTEECIALYLESFKAMARKGFISLDRTNLYDPDDNTYHIVCRPHNDIHNNTIDIQGITQLNLGNVDFLEGIKSDIKLLDDLRNVTKE